MFGCVRIHSCRSHFLRQVAWSPNISKSIYHWHRAKGLCWMLLLLVILCWLRRLNLLLGHAISLPSSSRTCSAKLARIIQPRLANISTNVDTMASSRGLPGPAGGAGSAHEKAVSVMERLKALYYDKIKVGADCHLFTAAKACFCEH
jgi:hypothetical protein